MPLTDSQIRAFKPATSRSYKRFDGGGLYIEVSPDGAKRWRYKYRFAGKENRLAFGVYPRVKLAGARRAKDDARRLIEDGFDPSVERKKAKAARHLGAGNTFSVVAKEYIRLCEKNGQAEATVKKAKWYCSLLEPIVGTVPLSEIDAQLLLAALRRIENRGTHETANKARGFAGRVFRHGIVSGRTTSNPADHLVGALVTRKARHRAALLDEGRLADFLRAVDRYNSPVTRLALKILAHVFVRPGELRLSTWAEFDLDKALWSIPAERMKMRKPHHVPLSPTVVTLLRETHQLTGPEGYVFPASHTWRRPMSENTLNHAMRRMGFTKDEATAHGFRSTASSFLNEGGQFNPDVIELALAHAPKNAIRAAYNRAEHWEERVRMAAWWSDYLTGLERTSID